MGREIRSGVIMIIVSISPFKELLPFTFMEWLDEKIPLNF